MRTGDKIMLVLMSIMLLTMVVVITSYAYFQINETHGITVSSGAYDIELVVKFSGTVVTVDSPYYDQEHGKIIANAFDELADNYIGNMTIDLVITPDVAARLRFKIQQEWELQRYYLDQDPENPIDPIFESIYHSQKPSEYYPYSLMMWAGGINTQYEQDGMVYYMDVIPSSEETTISLIDGGSPYTVRTNSALYEECYVYFDLFLDVVQANRFSEVWGIDPAYFN